MSAKQLLSMQNHFYLMVNIKSRRNI